MIGCASAPAHKIWVSLCMPWIRRMRVDALCIGLAQLDDGVPARHLLAAVGEDVADDAQRGLGGKDVGAASDVLLEDVVLNGSGQLVGGHYWCAVIAKRDIRESDRAGGK